MERKIYITEEEQIKCRKVADAFAELEDADVVVIDAGRYGFVKLQFYTRRQVLRMIIHLRTARSFLRICGKNG